MTADSDTVGAMTTLHADPAALRLLAARCRTWATDLTSPAPSGPGSIPATAAAVATVHCGLSATAGELARRMAETADLLDEAAGDFQNGDLSSAASLRGAAIRR